MSVVLGVDIGGSHITAALIDLEARSVVEGSSQRKLVNSQGSAEEILASWCEVIRAAFSYSQAASRKIGIAMPGPFDYEAGISLIEEQDKFQALYRMNIKNILATRLGMQSDAIRFINDASCFLQGEVFCGAARGYNKVLGLTLGTGLGSAVCNEGMAEDADLWKSPFREGIAEDYLSTRWFEDRYRELTGTSVSAVKELLETADSTLLEQVFGEFSDNLAQFLLPQIRKFHSEAVVFGGNISNAFPFFQPALEAKLHAQGVAVVLKQALLHEEASLIGAASSWNVSIRQLVQ